MALVLIFLPLAERLRLTPFVIFACFVSWRCRLPVSSLRAAGNSFLSVLRGAVPPSPVFPRLGECSLPAIADWQIACYN